MGSFTPFASGWCAVVCAWGILTSVLIDCSPTLISLLDESLILKGSGDRDQISRFSWSLGPAFFHFFPHMRNLDAPQDCFDALVHLAQGLANIAPIGLVALSANGDAGGDK